MNGVTNFRVVDEKYDYVERYFWQIRALCLRGWRNQSRSSQTGEQRNYLWFYNRILFIYLNQDFKNITSSIMNYGYEKCDYVDSDYVWISE